MTEEESLIDCGKSEDIILKPPINKHTLEARNGMASPNEKGSHHVRSKLKAHSDLLNVAVILVALSVTIAFIASLEDQPPCGLCYTQVEQLTITKVSFGSMPGQVTFDLSNSGTMNVTILQVYQGTYSGYNASFSTRTVIPAATNTTLTIIFANITFQHGTRYDFELVSSQGNRFPASGTR